METSCRPNVEAIRQRKLNEILDSGSRKNEVFTN
jgi:hypothetical protein